MNPSILRALVLFIALAASPTLPSAHARVPVNPREEAAKKAAQAKVSRVPAKPSAPAPKKPAPNASGARNPLTGSNVGGGQRPVPRPTAKPAPKPAPKPSTPSVSRPVPKAPTPPTVSRPTPKAPTPPTVSRPTPKAPTPPTVSRPVPKAPAPPTVSRPMPKAPTPPTVSRPSVRPSVPIAKGPPTKPPGGNYNRPGTNPSRPKPKPKPPVVSTPRPKLPPVAQGRPGKPGSGFVPGKVSYPGQIAKPAPRPKPSHPAHPVNRPQPRPLNQIIGSNVNSNNTNITNVVNNTNINNTTINHIHNTNYNKWVNNNTTIWNNQRVVNNRPVYVNPNFQRSVNYAYRPTSWGGRPWWSSSTYHNWHHGSWNYGWNRSWENYHSYYRPSYGPSYYLPGYRPAPSYRSTVSWGIAAWSLGSLAYELGYNSYRNPYTAPPVQTRTTVINYTQPLSVVASREEPEPEPAALTSQEKASAATALARASFRSGDYLGSLKSTDEAISYAPGDSALHEFRALCLFALGRYGDAAGVLNPVLASGPGWDWATMSDFYADGEIYTAQLRKLEAYVGSRPDGADAHFVLGYHYMVGGFIDEAYAMFDRVTELQPADTVAAQLRDLAESSSANANEEGAEEGTSADAPEAPPEGIVVEALDPVDIEGIWKAPSAGGNSITLVLGSDGKFSWTYDGAADGKVLEGEWSIDDESRLVLSAGDVQMVAEVSLDGDAFQFVLAGSPVGDPGLLFQRQ